MNATEERASKYRKRSNPNDILAMYQGDEIICVGTIDELAKYRGVQTKTIRFYMSNVHREKITSRKTNYEKGAVLVERLDDEEG